MNFRSFDDIERPQNKRNRRASRNAFGMGQSLFNKPDPVFDNFDRRFNFMWKLFWVFFGFVFVGIIVWYLFIGTVAVKLVDKVQDNGLKSIVEQVWEGPHAADTK